MESQAGSLAQPIDFIEQRGAWAMCEANAYLRKDGQEELFLEAVDKVVPHEDGLILEDIFGRRKIIKARIAELALVDHRIILEKE